MSNKYKKPLCRIPAERFLLKAKVETEREERYNTGMKREFGKAVKEKWRSGQQTGI